MAEDGTISVAGQADESYQPVLPFTEYQQRRRAELEVEYGMSKEI